MERIPFFLFHSLTNQEKITNKSLLCYCIQIIFTSSVRFRNAEFVLACIGFKAGSCFVFPREFSSLFRVSRGRFGLLRLLSCGDLRLLRDVTGKLSSAIVEFVAPLRLWHSLRLPPMVGSEVSVQRTGARWRAQLRKREA